MSEKGASGRRTAERWAIYARYSSDRQRAASIDDQIRLCRERIERDGGEVVEVYSDAALSGSSRRRPGLEALLADAADGRFDAVMAEALDRLSRDQEDTAHIAKRLAFAGARLVTAEEGEINALHVGFKGTVNAVFLDALKAKVRRGLSGRVAAGKSAGGRAYGYRVVRRLDEAGNLVTGELEIDEDEAAIVREVFARYVSGEGPKSIAHDLNCRGVPAQGGGNWSTSTIVGHAQRGVGILHNRLYVGERIWNRSRKLVDPETGRRVSRPNPESEWQREAVPHLAIVPVGLFEAAQDAKARRAAQPLAKRRRPKRVLAGLIHCGCCGGPMTVIDRASYGCRNHRERGTCDNGRRIKAAELESRVLAGVSDQLLAPDAAAAFVEAYQAEARKLQAEEARARRTADKRLADLARQIDRLVDHICQGTDTPASNAKLVELEAEKARLEAEQPGAPDPAKVARLYPRLADQYRELVAGLAEALAADQAGQAEAIEIVRAMTGRVVVTPPAAERLGAGRRGSKAEPCAIELHGSLATLLVLAGADQAAEEWGISLVPGDRFRRYPSFLPIAC